MALLTLILKIITWLISSRPGQSKCNKNRFDTDNDSDIGSGRINDRISNLLSNIKKMSSGAGFFTSKASLAFT